MSTNKLILLFNRYLLDISNISYVHELRGLKIKELKVPTAPWRMHHVRSGHSTEPVRHLILLETMFFWNRGIAADTVNTHSTVVKSAGTASVSQIRKHQHAAKYRRFHAHSGLIIKTSSIHTRKNLFSSFLISILNSATFPQSNFSSYSTLSRKLQYLPFQKCRESNSDTFRKTCRNSTAYCYHKPIF